MPDGILTNSSSQYVRDFILERFQLLAVVSLPQCAFAHFGAGVKASVIFVRKRDNNEVVNNEEYSISMFCPQNRLSLCLGALIAGSTKMNGQFVEL